MSSEKAFSQQDKQLLQQVTQALRGIDIPGKNNQDRLEKLIEKITAICESTATKAFAVTDENKEYVVWLEVNHDTNPAEIRFYIQEKLKTKFGQIFKALKNRQGATTILILTKDGYRETNPEELDKYRDRRNNRDKHIAEYNSASCGIIHDALIKFRRLISL